MDLFAPDGYYLQQSPDWFTPKLVGQGYITFPTVVSEPAKPFVDYAPTTKAAVRSITLEFRHYPNGAIKARFASREDLEAFLEAGEQFRRF